MEHFAYQPLTVAVPVRQGGIDEIHAQLEGAAQGFERFVVASPDPLLAAYAPGAIANLADANVCFAKSAVFHIVFII